MLSPGQFHKLVPKKPLENLLFRKFILEGCDDPEFLAGVMEMCRQDFVFWCDSMAIQFNRNPLLGDEVGPFITWPWQEEYALDTIRIVIEERKDMLWEKSREMSGTWLALLIASWLVIFHSNKKVVCLSHTIDAVEKPGEDDTLFAKFDFINDNLPKWMTDGRERLAGVINYPKRRSSISAVAATKTTGVGSRVSLLILDEFSKQLQAEAILSQTKATGPRLFIGTHYGVGTTYYDLSVRPDMHKRVFHWSMHPEKRRGLYQSGTAKGFTVLDTSYEYPVDFKFVMDGTPDGGPFPGLRSPWYDAECADPTTTSRDIAMHQDIDPKGATAQFFDRIIMVELKRKCVEPWFVGEILFEPGSGKPLEFVKRDNGPLRLWCNLDLNGRPPLARYGGGSDLSAGTGATPTCLSILNADVGTKAAEYITPRVKPEAFAIIAYALCMMFKSKTGQGMKLCWEANGPGLAFTPAFMQFGYTNIHYRETTAGIQGDQFVRSATTTPGWWNPNNAAIEAILAPYEAALRSGKLTNYSEYALDECLSYAYDKQGKISHSKRRSPLDPSGARENHGDIVIADALAWKMCVSFGDIIRAVEAKVAPSIYTLEGRRKLWAMRQRAIATAD